MKMRMNKTLLPKLALDNVQKYVNSLKYRSDRTYHYIAGEFELSEFHLFVVFYVSKQKSAGATLVTTVIVEG